MNARFKQSQMAGCLVVADLYRLSGNAPSSLGSRLTTIILSRLSAFDLYVPSIIKMQLAISTRHSMGMKDCHCQEGLLLLLLMLLLSRSF